MDHDPFQRCVWAFVRRDYPVAARVAMDVLRTGVSLGMVQILAISMRRTGVPLDGDALGRTLRDAVADPWESALLDVTLGLREPATVLAEANGELQRCQALCYVGTHLITTGDLAGGRRHLRECLDLGVECMESLIASMDTDLLDQWSRAADPDAEVTRLRRAFHALRSGGHHEQSIHIADLVLALVVGRHGAYHPEIGHCLNELAMAHAATGDWARAQPLLADALQMSLLFDGASSAAYATILDNLAQAEDARGRSDVAEEMHREALAAFARAVGADHPSYATCLGNLALVRVKLGRFAEAEPLYREAVDLRRRLFGTDDTRYIAMVDGLVDVYTAMGKPGSAEPLLVEVIDVVGRVKGADSPEHASRLKQLGDLYHRMGRHSDSVGRYRRALTIDQATLGFDHPTTVTTAARTAVAEKLAGRFGEAVRLYRYAMNHQTGADLAVTTHNLAVLHLEAGDTRTARGYAEEAIELHRSAGLEDTVDHALLLIGGAGIDVREGRHDDAERTLRLAMDLIERKAGRDEHYANACGALAKVRIAQHRYDEADDLLRTNLRLLEEAVGDDAPAIAVTVGLLGTVRLAQGRWDSAEELFRRAIGLLGGADRSPLRTDLLRDLASALAGMGREREAIDVLLTAERHQDRLILEKSAVSGISSLAVDQPIALLTLLGRPRFQSPELVWALVEVVWRRKGIVAEADFVRRREEIHSRRHDGGDVRAKLAALSRTLERGEMPRLSDIEDVAETYARNLRYEMYPNLEAAHRDLYEHLMEGWPEQGDLSREEWVERVTEYVGRAGFLLGDRDRLESDLRTLFHGDGWLGEVLPRVTPEAVRSRLPEGSALVEFLCVPTLDLTAVPADGKSRWKPDRYYAFVVTPDEVRLVDLGPADTIDADISLLRRATTRAGRTREIEPDRFAPDDIAQEATTSALALRKSLLDPLGIHDRTRWFVAPDAQLHTLPFEILRHDDGRLVIDTQEIAYLTTGRDLIPAHPSAPAGPPVVIADPDYDLASDDPTSPTAAPDERRAGLHFTRLPGTHDEGRHIADLLGVEPWLGADAVEGPLKRQQSPVVLHIASHGYFLDDQPAGASGRAGDRRAFSAFPAPLLNSGLALAGANTWLRRGHLPPPAEDGLLTAADLATMDLAGTELVVLSACDTGRGLIAVGQGVYGLRRSVGIAGARTLVMSLWQVPDRETQELMEDFYSRLKRGEPRLSAFRAARLALRARKPDPYYWGAFICQGDPGPMPASFLTPPG